MIKKRTFQKRISSTAIERKFARRASSGKIVLKGRVSKISVDLMRQ